MDPLSKIDSTFHQLRKMPDEIPMEKVEQFVLAQAAIGITAVAAPSLLKKLALKFHLNSIVVMTTAATASLVSLFIWSATSHKQVLAQNNFRPNNHSHQLTFIEKNRELAVDTPTTVIRTTDNSTTISVTSETSSKKVATTNISVVTKGDSVVTTVYASDNDSTYSYSYAKGNAPQKIVVVTTGEPAAELPVLPTVPDMAELAIAIDAANEAMAVTGAEMANLPNMAWEETPPTPPICMVSCGKNDSLLHKVEDALVKDGLISDRQHYAFKITGNTLKVNGVKQNDETYKRYKEIIETNSRNKVNRKFVYAISVDGDSISMDMENFVD